MQHLNSAIFCTPTMPVPRLDKEEGWHAEYNNNTTGHFLNAQLRLFWLDSAAPSQCEAPLIYDRFAFNGRWVIDAILINHGTDLVSLHSSALREPVYMAQETQEYDATWKTIHSKTLVLVWCSSMQYILLSRPYKHTQVYIQTYSTADMRTQIYTHTYTYISYTLTCIIA